MIRQTIVLNGYTYILDLYKASSDLSDNKHYEEFMLIKKTKIMNSIMYDEDVYFINKSIVDNCIIDGVLDTDLLSNTIAYPVTKNGVTLSYSRNFKNFNDNFTNMSYMPGYDIFHIYDKSCERDASILCDKLRIWLPITNGKLNGIIHVSNIINDIKFHYICQRSDSLETDSNNEMKVGNNIYSEYIDIWVPNVEYLFTQSNCYIKEEFNTSEIRQKIVFKQDKKNTITIQPRIYFDIDENYNVTKKIKINAIRSSFNDDSYNIKFNDEEISWNFAQTEDFIRETNDENSQLVVFKNNEPKATYNLRNSEILYSNNTIYMSLFLMILPFYIEDALVDDQLNKRKCKLYYNIDTAIVDDSLITPLIVSIYPYDYIDAASSTYCQEYQVLKNADMFTLSKDIKLKASFGFCNDNSIGSYGALMLNCEFNSGSALDIDDINKLYLSKSKCDIYDYLYFNESGDSYDTDVFPEQITKCGFVVEMSPDNTFKDIVYKYVKNIVIENETDDIISNCSFGLNFDCGQEQWNAYPETLVLRARYVDKVSFNTITSNLIFITKDIFKYLINGNEHSSVEYRLKMYDNNQIYEEDAVDFTKFNFIDKINCVVVKNENDSDNSITNSKTNSRIIYKPIFFKVKDLQQLKIKSGITQNIALNLSDFISKVDTFKITIEGKEYVEIARNEGYVIFKINALELSSNNGQYNLLNQDDEFISDGTWYTY